MNKIGLIISSFSVLFLVSCENKEKYKDVNTFTFDDFGKSIALQSENIDFDEPIMSPRRILLVDSIILVENKNTEFLLYRYNVLSRKKTGECIAFGSGPNELLTIKHIQSVDSCIYISDNQKRVVFEYNKHDLCHGSNPEPQKTVTTNEAISSFQHIPDGYVSTTMNPFNKRFLFFNSEGNFTETKGEYPSLGKEITGIEKVEGYLADMTFDPVSKRIFLFYAQTDLLEIYDLTGKLIKRMHGPDQFFPHVKEIALDGGYSKISPVYGESREAYYAPVIVNNEVYVSYSGAFRESKRAPITTILVFNTDGYPLRKYELSEPIIAFTVDPTTKNIYATSDDPEFHLIKFNNKTE